jgi:hypothetical protein
LVIKARSSLENGSGGHFCLALTPAALEAIAANQACVASLKGLQSAWCEPPSGASAYWHEGEPTVPEEQQTDFDNDQWVAILDAGHSAEHRIGATPDCRSSLRLFPDGTFDLAVDLDVDGVGREELGALSLSVQEARSLLA